MNETQHNIPQQWKIIKLNDIASISYGKGLPTKNLKPEGFPVFGANSIIGFYDKYLFENQQLLISCRGANSGTINTSPPQSFVTNNSLVVSFPVHQEILRKTFFYFLQAANKEGLITGSAQPQVTINNAVKIILHLPPLNEQKRIVAKIEELFSELDKGVESLKTARAQLKIYRQAVLKHAFEGKLTAQWREDNKDKLESADDLLERIKKEREARYKQQLEDWQSSVVAWEKNGKGGPKPRKPANFKAPKKINNSELDLLPHIPNNWRFVRLSEIASIGSGMSVSASRKVKNPILVPYLRVANVQRGFLDLSVIKDMSIENEQLKMLELNKWDILFNEGGDRDKLGRGWVWQSEVQPCITQNHVFRATPYITSEITSKLISHWGNTFGQKYFEKTGKQTTNLASINKGVLSEFPIPLIPPAEEVEIFQQLEKIMALLDAQENEVSQSLLNAEALRQSILKKAFSGKLVAQDLNDKPASVLLERIKAEKNNNKKKGKAA